MNKHVRSEHLGKVTSKGQTTVPKPVRDALGLKPGMTLDWTIDGREVRVRARSLNIADFADFLGPPPSGRTLTIEEMDDAIAAAVAERSKR
jgi:antitoxin PrlF